MSRRLFLKAGIGVLALGGMAYWQRNSLMRYALTRRVNNVVPTLAPQIGADVCVLTPEQMEGPYYIKSPIRSSIHEGQRGLPLLLNMEVVKLPDCTPMDNVTIEIWHCDARGGYSGYGSELSRAPFELLLAPSEDGHVKPTETTTYLRGGQISDSNGQVQFETIFPGWYEPRVTHIHAKLSQNGKAFLTTQLYFSDELTHQIYSSNTDYMEYGLCPYSLKNDMVIGDLTGGTGVILDASYSDEMVTASVRFGIA